MTITTRLPLFPLLIAAALLMTVLLNVVGEPLMTPAAPSGIISFELAGAPPASAAILASWDASARRIAAFSLGLDYLFMVVYAAAFAWASLKAGALLQRLRWPLSGLGRWVAWGSGLAALFDAVENLALAVILFGGAPAAPWPQLASACAMAKFGLLFLALVYIFYSLAAVVASQMAR